MALKRLDEEFDLKPGTQLLPYMQRLLPSLEGRFQEIEADQDVVNKLAADIRAAALLRMNEILIPATEDIIAVTKLGFLLAPISTPYKLVMGYMAMIVDEGPQRDAFTPSPYLIIEHSINDYALARLVGYHQEDGLLEVTVTAIHGNAGPWSDWMVSSTPGMADSTKLYHDEVGPWRDEVVADHAEVVTMHAEILAAFEALQESGLDLSNYVRRDGTVPFTAVQRGVAPPTGSNDVSLATTNWSRARMQEYVGQAMQRTGDTMTGPLYLNTSSPSAPLQAASKGYVDSLVGQPHWMNDYLGIRGNAPALLLQTTGTGQNRFIQSNTPSGLTRWQLLFGDGTPESGGDAGSNFQLFRYNDPANVGNTALTISRQNGDAVLYGALSVRGIVSAAGDFRTSRPAAPTTGCLYFGTSGSAYHFFDGTHHLAGGPVSTENNALYAGHTNTYSIYTQGYAITTWGLTSHAAVNVNSTLNANAIQVNSTGPIITMYDTDWGPMHLHHQSDLMGFLNNGGGWCFWATNAGHLWSAQYGWVHDYINQQASAYAWNVGSYYWGAANGTFARDSRLVYAGDWNWSQGIGYDFEPAWGAVQTGWYQDYYMNYHNHRLRTMQLNINGGWYTANYA